MVGSESDFKDDPEYTRLFDIITGRLTLILSVVRLVYYKILDIGNSEDLGIIICIARILIN